jgi:xylulokinase
MILTIDLGTSATKVLVWDAEGTRAQGRAELVTVYGPDGRAEQDAGSWWTSVVQAADAARAGAPDLFGAVEAVALSSARQTFVPVSADGSPLGDALLWSDRRAGAEARRLRAALGGAHAAKERTGVVLDAGAVSAKMAWLAGHEPDRISAARWLLSPREVVVHELTGEVCSDPTLASASGLYDPSGDLLTDLIAALGDIGALGAKLPPPRPSDTVAGPLLPPAAEELGLRPGIPVVVGAGDRACEVLGAGAGEGRCMVSWGTTANVSVPVDERPDPLPDGLTTSRGAISGWLLEGGVSAAGSLLSFVAELTAVAVDDLWVRAGAVPPGARGLVVLPWPNGARAPWWAEGARAAVLGLSFAHDAGDLARAVLEAVAFELVRCLAQATTRPDHRPGLQGIALGGGAARTRAWTEVLTGITALPARRRRSGEAASAGAALLGWRALGVEVPLEQLDPVVEEIAVDDGAAERYAALRPRSDAAAAAVLGLGDLGPPG